MLKTTVKYLAFFLALFIGISAGVTWRNYSAYRAACESAREMKIVVRKDFPLPGKVVTESADARGLAPCKNPNPAKDWIPAGKYRTISGGVLNNQLTCGVLPEYPAAALERGISGDVTLNVLIDEWGAISKASVKSGHPVFRQAVLKAALQSGTTPRLLGGESVRMRGILLYRFDGEKAASFPKNFPTTKSAPLDF